MNAVQTLSSFRYRVAAPSGDPEHVFTDLRRRAADDPGADPRVFRWAYRQCPAGEGLVLVLEAEREGAASQVVGWAGLQPRAVLLDRQELRAAVLVNLAVAPQHRSVRPALMLQRAVRRAALAFDLSYGYPNRAALGGFVRAGYRKLGSIDRYACVLRHAPLLELRGAPAPVARPVGGAADALLAAARRALWLRWTPRLAFAWHTVLGADLAAALDRMWRRAAESGRGLRVRRDADFVRWRYLENPSEPHRLAILTSKSGREPVGFAAVRLDRNRAGVDDLFAIDDEHLGALLDALLEALYSEDVSAIDITFFGRQRVLDILNSRGFRNRGETRHLVIATPENTRLDAARLSDPESWYLMPGDGDL